MKTKEITKEICDNHTEKDLILTNSSLRYILETLITTKLMCIEEDYTEKIYYSLFYEQKSKINRIISRVQNELKILQELEHEYNSEINSKDPGILKHSPITFEIERKYIDKSKEYITAFFDGLEHTGLNFHQYLIKKQILSNCENDLKNLNNEIVELLKKENVDADDAFYVDEFFKNKKDYRSWVKRAEKAELADEYNFIYDYTSSLIHATPFSLLTLHSMSQPEMLLIFRLYDQYLERIIENIKIVNNLNNIQFFHISEE